MHFAAGHHRIWWNDKGEMVEKTLQDNEIFRQINLFPVALSIITSRLTANDPRWNPKKSGMEDVSFEEIEAADAALQDIWEGEYFGDRSIKKEMKLMIRHGYLQGGRLAYFRWDDDADMPVMDTYSLWDVYSDPAAECLYDKRWLAIVVPKSIEWLKEQVEKTGWNKKIVDDLQSDQRLAESKLHEQYLNRRMGGAKDKSKQDTVKCIYAFGIESGKVVHRILVEGTKSGELYKEETDYKNLSEMFAVFHPVHTGEFYPRPPCMDWIDPQKTINKIYSNVETYIDNFLQGKWLIANQDVVLPIAGAQGQKIYGSANDLQMIPMQPLPSTHFQHLGQAITQFEQISGVHSETLGRQSGGAESGVAIAQLQALDEQNSADPVDNFKMFMKVAGQHLLELFSENWSETKPLYRYDRMGNEKQYKVIGEAARKTRKDSVTDDTVSIRPFKRLDIEIVIGQFFNKVQQRENITQLLSVWQPGANPTADAVVLPMIIEAFNIGEGREMVKELKKFENPQLMIAEAKSRLIAAGEEVPINTADQHAFLQGVYAQKATAYLNNGDQTGAQRLNDQAAKHAAFLEQGMGGVGSPELPEDPNAAAALFGQEA
jgi:hypothetical protein